jgi:exosome complex component RRP42
MIVETGIVPTANGSARVTLTDEGTSVLASAKLQIVEHTVELKDNQDADDEHDSDLKNRLRCSVDIWGKIRFEWRNFDRESLRIDISQFVERVFNEAGVLDQHKLTIVPNKLYWNILLDLSIEQFGGNVVDVAFLAARSALWHLKIPKLTVDALNDGAYEYSVDEAMDEEPMIVDDLPVAITLHKMGGKYYCVDCMLDEEQCSEGSITVAVNKFGHIAALKKGAVGGIQPGMLTDMIQTAKKIAIDAVKKLEGVCK